MFSECCLYLGCAKHLQYKSTSDAQVLRSVMHVRMWVVVSMSSAAVGVDACRCCISLTGAPRPRPSPSREPLSPFLTIEQPMCYMGDSKHLMETDVPVPVPVSPPFELSILVDDSSCLERLLPEMLVSRVNLSKFNRMLSCGEG